MYVYVDHFLSGISDVFVENIEQSLPFFCSFILVMLIIIMNSIQFL